MKEIKLVPDQPFYNNVDVAVLDFPGGLDGKPRQRCKISVEYAQVDVEQLKQQGMDYDAAIRHYEDWLYHVVRFYLAQDWTCVGGYEELMDIIKEHVRRWYE